MKNLRKKGIIDLIVMAIMMSLVLLGAVLNIAPIMNLIKFGSPFFLILTILIALGGYSKKEDLIKWQQKGSDREWRKAGKGWEKTSRSNLPPDFGEVGSDKSKLWYRLISAGYVFIIGLLVAFGHFILGIIWLIILIAVLISWGNYKEIRKMAEKL